MTSRNRRRDLTVSMRHKDTGLVVYARLTNKRERLTARRSLAALTGKEVSMARIKSARITKQPQQLFDPMPKVYVTLENGEEQFLFEYYPDELFFSPNEFVGLTIDEARSLKHKKDVAYLRS